MAFFSGISGEEQVALMEAWSDCTGLDAPAFASGARAVCLARVHGVLLGQQMPEGMVHATSLHGSTARQQSLVWRSSL